MLDWSAREWSSFLSIITMAGLLWRTIGYWREMTPLEDLLTGFVMCYLTIGAIASFNLDRANAPASGTVGWSITLKVLIGIAIITWPKIIGHLGPAKAERFR